MKIYGVCNASPDSLNPDSIVSDVDSALRRAKQLLVDGADMIDLGGQGSTHIATEVDEDIEWARLADLIPAIRTLNVDLSVDTWRPSVMRRSLEAGATVMNAADGLQAPGMLEVAADYTCPIVLPFMNGPDPLRLEHVHGDAVEVMVEWFDKMLRVCDRYGVRKRIILDPGTGFAPLGWEWSSRYHFQKHVYSNLDRLRAFDLPVYIALPWRETEQHEELLRIVLRSNVDYGRAHYPAHIREVEGEVEREVEREIQKANQQ
jgi:dihydropteroate synthase